jgi:hypothetical protein
MIEAAICQHRDQAVLCTIVGEANKTLDPKAGAVSRQALMHAFCYCKVAGLPIERRFLIYPTGPVADDILLDIEALELDQAIRNVSVVPEERADYTSGIGALSLCAKHRVWLETHRPLIRGVLRALRPYTKEHLAQVACLHFLFLHMRRETGTDNLPARVIAEFLAAAPGEEWEVSQADAVMLYERMVEANLIPSEDPQQGSE